MPRYFAALWAWLREHLDPTLPPPHLRGRPAPPAPPPTRRFRLEPCPRCRFLVVPGDRHDCRDLGGEGG